MSIAVVALQAAPARFLADALAQEGFRASVAAGADAADGADIALILMGVDHSGALALIAHLRAHRPSTPRIAVTERDDVEARLAAYDAGADDCLSKPFHFRELVAKLRALQRRSRAGSLVPLLDGAGAAVDQVALELRMAGRSRSLTKREADLLVTLAQARGASVGRDEVLRVAWDAAPGLTENLVDVYVGYARRKLLQLGADVAVRSVRGKGFRIVAEPPGAASKKMIRT